MKFIGIVLLAISTTITSSLVSASTVGTLTYDSGNNIITDSATGTTYLGWDVLADYTYAQTLAATQAGGAYEGFHIATQTEAFTFYHAAGGNTLHEDKLGHDSYGTSVGIYEGFFGANFDSENDIVWFLSDETQEVGYIWTLHGTINIFDNWNPIYMSDSYSATGSHSDTPISWLLVSDNSISPVPVPAALPLFATALAVFGWMRRRKQTKTS